MTDTVIGVLRQFLPDFLKSEPVLDPATRRAIWAISHCRSPIMGGHLHACRQCNGSHYLYHSCNHRSCPLCGRQATAEWVQQQINKRIEAPYFMVTFTLPQSLRTLFTGARAKEAYDVFFAAASAALTEAMAHPRWLGASSCGFTMILHTWNQRMQFHPHLHCIVPGAGIDRRGRVVSVKKPTFLVPQPVLRKLFRSRFRQRLALLAKSHSIPPLPPSLWQRDWGVHLQPFGDGLNAIKYLGAYVGRSVIGDSRILEVKDSLVRFRWKDRSKGGVTRTETLPGVEFVRRFLRHVLPSAMRSIRYYGFCHPAAKRKLKILASQGFVNPQPEGPVHDHLSHHVSTILCPICQGPLIRLPLQLLPLWKTGLSPPYQKKIS